MIRSIGLYALLFIACSCTQNKEEKIPAKVEELFSSEFKPDQPGAAVLVMKDGKVIFEKGYGIADVSTKEKITTETLFNIGSISKTFVSNTILSLADEGKLSVNDSLSKYFHDFRSEERRVGKECRSRWS